MIPLFLGEWKALTENSIKKELITDYLATQKQVNCFKILIACYENYGYEEASYLLLQDKKTGILYENHACHCSCYGFEDQFSPEVTTIDYLKSGHFHAISEYDEEIKKWINENL